MKRHQEFKRKRKEEFKKKYSIIQLLNEYGKQGVEDYSPLDVTEEDFDIVIDLAKQKLENIREIIELNEDKKSFGIFIYYAFKALFIGNYDLKYDGNLKEDISFFNDILSSTCKSEIIEKHIIKLRGELDKKDKGKKEITLFKKIFPNLKTYFIYLLLRRSQSTTQRELNEYIIRLVEGFCVTILHFKYDELNDLPHEQLINDLYKIFFEEKISNNFHLSLENDNLKAKRLTNVELCEYINEKNIDNTTDKIEENTEEKKDMNQKSKSKVQRDKKFNNRVKDIRNDDIKGAKSKEKAKENINKDEQNEFEKINGEIYILKQKINYLENKLEKYDSQVKSLKKKINDYDAEISRLKSDLKLIKLRRAFKVFVNYIYNGLRLFGDIYYEDKIEGIIEKLDTFNTKEYDSALVQSSIDFMDELYNKNESGNFAAHHLDLNVSVLDQIFEYIDKTGKYTYLKNKLKSISCLDQILKDLIKNREDNFSNPKRLKAEEERIIKTIGDLSALWKKK